jgi:hypothetical protein
MLPVSSHVRPASLSPVDSARAGGSARASDIEVRSLSASIRPEASCFSCFAFLFRLRQTFAPSQAGSISLRDAPAGSMPGSVRSPSPAASLDIPLEPIPPASLNDQLRDAVTEDSDENILDLLRQGADPLTVDTTGLEDNIATLLERATQVRRLYPPGQSLPPSNIDEALQNFEFDNASHYLSLSIADLPRNGGIDQFSSKGIWRRAVEHQRYDVLRGMLVLRNAAGEIAGCESCSDVSVLHSALKSGVPPALAAHLKQWPYFAQKEGRGMHSLNGKINYIQRQPQSKNRLRAYGHTVDGGAAGTAAATGMRGGGNPVSLRRYSVQGSAGAIIL